MGFIIGGSIAFSVGSGFLQASNGFTRFVPTMVVVMCFIVGAGMLAKAASTMNMSTTIVLGIGFEALAAVAIGIVLLGDRLTTVQAVGIVFVVLGVMLVRP